MAESNSGLKGALRNGLVYDLFQTALGSSSVYGEYARNYLRLKDGYKVLDIGCGTGKLLDFLPDGIDFTGCDYSERYIEKAKTKYGEKGQWIHVDSNDLNSLFPTDKKFDVVMANGLFHHLNDAEVSGLVKTARSLLDHNGVFMSIDICKSASNFLGNVLASVDRGKNVRDLIGYKQLVAREFTAVEAELKGGLSRLPYTYAIIRAES